MATLDIGVSEKPSISKYECAWWKGRQPTSLDTVECLNKVTLKICMDTHRSQLAAYIPTEDDERFKLDTKRPVPATMLTTRAPTLPGAAGPSSNVGPAPNIGPGTPAGVGADICQKCVHYKFILSDTLNDIVDIHGFTNAMSTASKTQWKVDMRRASTFNLLYEAAVIKETDAPSRPVPSSSTPAAFAKRAKEELIRLQGLPVSSYKWTWGATLTEKDVLSLNRSGTRPKNPVHSGYDISLKEGRQLGEDTHPSMPSSDGRYEDLPVEVYEKPPINLSANLPQLSIANRLYYDPLSIPNPPVLREGSKITNEVIPAAPFDALDKTVNSDEDKSAPDEDKSAPKEDESAPVRAHGSAPLFSNVIADRWIPEDEEYVPTNRQLIGPQSIAEAWIAESDDEAPSSPSLAISRTVADKWIPESDEERLDAERPRVGAVTNSNVLADEWVPFNDETSAMSGSSNMLIADNWLSENDDDGPAPVLPDSPPINKDQKRSSGNILAQDWVSACDEIEMRGTDGFEASTSGHHISSSLPVRRYRPEDFAHLLEDDMFEEVLSEDDDTDE